MNSLGYQAKREPLWLSSSADLLAKVKTTTPVPAGSIAQIVLANGTVWVGTLNSLRDTFEWRVEAVDTTAAKVPEGTAYYVIVTMPRSVGGGNDDVKVLFGNVIRQD